jgi:hypothetical protein
MRGGNGVRGRFLVLADQNQEAPVAQAVKEFCESLPGIVEMRPSREAGIKLVRPDGYLAYSADAGTEKGVGAAILEMRLLLERQTTPDRAHAAGDA